MYTRETLLQGESDLIFDWIFCLDLDAGTCRTNSTLEKTSTILGDHSLSSATRVFFFLGGNGYFTGRDMFSGPFAGTRPGYLFPRMCRPSFPWNANPQMINVLFVLEDLTN